MHKVLCAGELQPSPRGTVTFEGEPYSSGISFFLANNQPVCIHASPRMIQENLE